MATHSACLSKSENLKRANEKIATCPLEAYYVFGASYVAYYAKMLILSKCGRLNPRTGHIMKGTNFAQMGKTRPFNLIHEACCRPGTIINTRAFGNSLASTVP